MAMLLERMSVLAPCIDAYLDALIQQASIDGSTPLHVAAAALEFDTCDLLLGAIETALNTRREQTPDAPPYRLDNSGDAVGLVDEALRTPMHCAVTRLLDEDMPAAVTDLDSSNVDQTLDPDDGSDVDGSDADADDVAASRSLGRQWQRRRQATSTSLDLAGSPEDDTFAAGMLQESRGPGADASPSAVKAAVQRTVLVLERHNLMVAAEAKDELGRSALDIAPTLFAHA
jgi:hypothetical protein